ncbi:MAG: C25 family cysteine peptidase [Burkholderiales bacterium]
MKTVLLRAPRAALPDLAELIGAWEGIGARVRVSGCDGALPDVAAWVAAGDTLDAVLLVGAAARAPSTALAAPFATDRSGRRVPVAWLPASSPAALRRFAAAAARAHRRHGRRPAVALLGQWHPQYLRVVDRLAALVRDKMDTFRWSGERIGRDELVQALGSGLGLGLYVGHGRPSGWVGYRGLRSHHFEAPVDATDEPPPEPMGALLSLCCRTASRRRIGLSYAESLPLRGVAAASFGATGDTLHTDNTRWAVGLCDAMGAGARDVGELITLAAPASPSAVAAYRLIGDPLAPLASTPRAIARARGVATHP